MHYSQKQLERTKTRPCILLSQQNDPRARACGLLGTPSASMVEFSPARPAGCPKCHSRAVAWQSTALPGQVPARASGGRGHVTCERRGGKTSNALGVLPRRAAVTCRAQWMSAEPRARGFKYVSLGYAAAGPRLRAIVSRGRGNYKLGGCVNVDVADCMRSCSSVLQDPRGCTSSWPWPSRAPRSLRLTTVHGWAVPANCCKPVPGCGAWL